MAGADRMTIEQVVREVLLEDHADVVRESVRWVVQLEAFRTRLLEGRYPYLFVDAKVEKVRDGGRVARKCVVIAHAVHETGRREIIGLDVGEAETEAFWREFLRSLVKRRPGRCA